MKVVIGTPIHQIKDYCIERWLKNVARLQKITPADLLLIDNSPTAKYMEKVKRYCKKHGIKNFQVKHLEIDQKPEANERINRSREIIRKHILSRNYDAWFSWECDQLIPADTLNLLLTLMKEANHLLVCLGSPTRTLPKENIAAFGVTLINKKALEKFSFYCAPEDSLKKQALKNGNSYIEVYGVVKPIYHLNH